MFGSASNDDSNQVGTSSLKWAEENLASVISGRVQSGVIRFRTTLDVDVFTLLNIGFHEPTAGFFHLLSGSHLIKS